MKKKKSQLQADWRFSSEGYDTVGQRDIQVTMR